MELESTRPDSSGMEWSWSRTRWLQLTRLIKWLQITISNLSCYVRWALELLVSCCLSQPDSQTVYTWKQPSQAKRAPTIVTLFPDLRLAQRSMGRYSSDDVCFCQQDKHTLGKCRRLRGWEEWNGMANLWLMFVSINILTFHYHNLLSLGEFLN